jgi:hypothetical protein
MEVSIILFEKIFFDGLAFRLTGFLTLMLDFTEEEALRQVEQ